MPDEEWRPVIREGFMGLYEVSKLGRSRSIKGNILTHDLNERGYHTIRLCNQGNKIRVTVHSLVLQAFDGPRPDGMGGRHLDDNKDDNGIANLKWGTQAENIQDQIRNGKNHNLNKTVCPLGHQLKHPNLRNRKKRECLACMKATTYCRAHGILDIKEEADKYYSMIMRGLGHIDRRKWGLYV
jgi:hypothetical protein